MSTNRVVMIGRLVRDPEGKTTSSGKDVTTFTIAVDRNGKKKEGEQNADFFRVTAWEYAARFVRDYLGKGRLVAVDGRLQSRSYTDKEGNKRETVEIIADSVQGLDRSPNAAPTDRHGIREKGTMVEAEPTDYDPFGDE